jgi:hypothetical protein
MSPRLLRLEFELLVVVGLLGWLSACVVRGGVAAPGLRASRAPAPASSAPSGRTSGAVAGVEPGVCGEELDGDASDRLADATPIAPGTLDGCLAPLDRGDVYAITAPADAARTLVRAEVDPQVDVKLCLELHDGDRARLALDGCDEGVRRAWFVVERGTTVYLTVRGWAMDWGDGKTYRPYRVALTAAPIPEPGEPDDTRARPLRLGERALGYAVDGVNGRDDVDHYEIVVADEGLVKVVVDDVPVNVLAVVKLLDTDGNELARKRAHDPGATVRLDRRVRPGTYRIRIEADSYLRGRAGIGDPREHVTRPYGIQATLER